ncbi:hypothetical protein [Parabacteroides pacaensis]|uniref:hypothetical protein n=1 Tax=Parabacteroides pacaensis TaxID=2086575 RepID=UPI000D0FFA46|nr:hypothetical protein [Parabacteroides pacaensis]
MKGRKLSKVEYIKIFSRVSHADYTRLENIRKKYGFKSNYQIMQYILHCFLRVADPENDQQIEPVPEEIKEMFGDFSQMEKHFEYKKPKRRCSRKTPDKP